MIAPPIQPMTQKNPDSSTTQTRSNALPGTSPTVDATDVRTTLNGVPLAARSEMIEVLNQLVADASNLHSQIKQAHWNVRGIHFLPLHELFDAVAGVLPPFVDALAERVGMLGGAAVGTSRAAAEKSRLPEISHGFVSSKEAIEAVAERLALVTNAARLGVDRASEAGDEITADLMTEVTRELDKQLWFVESHRTV